MTKVYVSLHSKDPGCISEQTELSTEGYARKVEPPLVCTFTVLGPPVGKRRAAPIVKFGKLTGKVTPEKTRDYESTIADMANLHLCRDWPLDRRYELHVVFRALTRDDVDNVLKSVADALNKLAWKDDRQVDYMTVRRVFEGEPRTEVKIVANAPTKWEQVPPVRLKL